jgi:hypothetical protein
MERGGGRWAPGNGRLRNPTGTSALPTDCPSRSRAQGNGDPGGRAVEFAAIGISVSE